MQLSKEFKIRSSCFGQIMTEPKKKTDLLSATCITYVQSWIKEQPEFYNRREDFSSKQTKKGILCEDDSIQFAADYFGWGMVEKNTEERENEYMTGTCDVQLGGSIEDIKNSWSQKTFPLFDTEIKNKDYSLQGQGYMELWGKPKFGLVYTLSDAPDELIEREARYKMRELGMEELEEAFYLEVKESMTYSHLPDHLRIKRFEIDRDPAVIAQVIEKVELIRGYIKGL